MAQEHRHELALGYLRDNMIRLYAIGSLPFLP